MNEKFPIYLLLMAGVTYLIRMLPLTFFKRKIKNRFVQSFLYYIPYAVLSCMTFPAVFSCTGNLFTAAAGVLAAVILAFYEKSLITVALCSSLAVLAAQGIALLF